MAGKKIAILLHERDRYPKFSGHFIWMLSDLWRQWGMKIEVLHGLLRRIDADLVIPHVDTTVMPEDYMAFLGEHPRVVNLGVRDISKRSFSKNLVSRDDPCDGPVIVKTDRNCGGITDLLFPGRKVRFTPEPQRLRNLFKRRKTSSDWSAINCISSNEYPIFASVRDVPEAVFANPALVVERFLPEMEGGFYHTRYYLFLGDREYCWRVRSPNPILKRADVILYQEMPVPEELRAVRRELDLDYGKLDFVMCEGRTILLDVNRTPGTLGTEFDRKIYRDRLAPGIRSLL